MTVTLGQLVEYVLKNRRGKAFFGYTEQQIAIDILMFAKMGTMLYDVNDNDEICGIVIADKTEEDKTMFVRDVLTTSPNTLKKFIAHFKSKFPTYRLIAQRWRGLGRNKAKIVNYNTDKLCNKIMKGTH